MWDVGRVTLSAGTWLTQLLNDSLEVELVSISLAVGFGKDELVVVVPQRSR